MVGKEKHVVAVLHFTVVILQLTFYEMQLKQVHLVMSRNILYTAFRKKNKGRKGENLCRK